tara:strand:+ start:14216 stop:15115 length:900 start_codon:yes stop_codon:yes gene_type:complete
MKHIKSCPAIQIVLIVFILSSCVPTKKLVYLQSDKEEEQVSYDSVVATYNLKLQRYQLKPEDVVSIRVASITDGEFNFVKQYETDLGVIRKLNQFDQAQQSGGGSNQMMMTAQSGEGGMSSILLDRLNTGFVLDHQGALDLPQIGKVQLAGMTIPEAEMKITELLMGYFETPMVRVQLLNFHFTMFGEVNREGRFTSFDPEITIFDAIAMAENLSEFADRSNIKLIRKDGDVANVVYLNLLDEKTLNNKYYYLQRGDMIIVPPLRARTSNQYGIPNASKTLGIVGSALSVLAIIISLSK